MSPGLEFNARLRGIPVYPAAATYAFEGDLVKLASNETPFPPHPQVLEAVEAQLRTLNRYPDPDKSLLRRRISERTGVPPGRVAVGNGSCELLLAAAEAMLEPDAEIVYAWPSFSIYPHMTAMSGARAITVPAERRGRARPRGDGPRGHRRHPDRAGLQPQQPFRPPRSLRRSSTPSRPSCPATWP